MVTATQYYQANQENDEPILPEQEGNILDHVLLNMTEKDANRLQTPQLLEHLRTFFGSEWQTDIRIISDPIGGAQPWDWMATYSDYRQELSFEEFAKKYAEKMQTQHPLENFGPYPSSTWEAGFLRSFDAIGDEVQLRNLMAILTHRTLEFHKDWEKRSSEEFVRNCLRTLEEDAEEEGVEFDEAARGEAERILYEMDGLPSDTEVYVEEDGSVTIDVLRNPHGGFILTCEPDRSALCVVVVNGVSRRARYRDSGMLPDCFVKDGLRDVLQASD